MKYVNEFGLRDGTQEEYKRRHDEIWPEMQALMEGAGIRNYTIWNLGTRLIEYYECEDAAATGALVHASPVKARWDEYMKDILVFPDNGHAASYRCMFDFNSTDK